MIKFSFPTSLPSDFAAEPSQENFWIISIAQKNSLPKTYQLSFRDYYRLLWIMFAGALLATAGFLAIGRQAYHMWSMHFPQKPSRIESTPLDSSSTPVSEFVQEESPILQQSENTLEPTSTHAQGVFSLFSDMEWARNPEQESVLKVTEPKLYWKENTLFVDFALEMPAKASKPQQGYLLLLLRTNTQWILYPKAPSPEHSTFLIDPPLGESFSVSRFRAVHGVFALPKERPSTMVLDVFLFSKDKRMVHHSSWPQ